MRGLSAMTADAAVDEALTVSETLVKIKIATWNVNSLNVRLPQVLGWLRDQPAREVQAADLTGVRAHQQAVSGPLGGEPCVGPPRDAGEVQLLPRRHRRGADHVRPGAAAPPAMP